MEVELDLWSSRDDAVDHILSDVDCLGDVVPDVDVDEFMLACSSAEASQMAGQPADEHAANFTPEPPLHHDDLTANNELHQHHHMGLQHHQHHHHHHQQEHQQNLQQHHHQMVASSQHMNLNSMFDDSLVSHSHQNHQQQHPTATNTFQHHSHQTAEQLHFDATRLTPNDLHQQHQQHQQQHHHHQQNQYQHEQQSHFELQHQNDLDPLNSLVIQHQSGTPFVHQFATSQGGQQQHQEHQQAQQESSSTSSSSLVAARVDHCYITAESPSSEAQHTINSDQLEAVSTSIALPDREQLQMLLDSRPQPISCPLGESPLIAVMNSKSQEPLSQSKGAAKRRQSQANSSSAKRQTKKQQQATTLTIRLDGSQTSPGVITSSEETADQSKSSAARNNNAKRAQTIALNSGANKSGGRPGRGKKATGAKTAEQLTDGEHQVSGQISPTLSSSSSSGVSSNYSDELGADSHVEDNSSSSSSSSQLYPDSAGQMARASPINKRRRQATPTGANKRPSLGRRATSASELEDGNSSIGASNQSGHLASKAHTENNLDDKLGHGSSSTPNSSTGVAISSSSPSGKSASQLNFEANLSAKSREKLSSLSSCLIQPVGRPFDQTQQQQQQLSVSQASSSSTQSSSGNIEQQTIKAPSEPNGGRQRSSVSSSSSVSSCSSMSPLAGSPANSLVGFVVSSANSVPPSSSSSASSSSSSSSSGSSPSSSSCASSSCSSFSSMQSPASERLASPVSSASCSPTIQLGTVANSSSSSLRPTTSSSTSSCSFSSSSTGSSCTSSAYSAHQSAALISSQDWKSAPSGQTVQLTEEERRTLLAAGYPIPQKFPLSKAEERSLKKIRRKIKNKISAQESRRKKKEYMEELEKRVQLMELRISELERENERLVKERRGSSLATSPNSSSSSSSASSSSSSNKSNGAASKLKRSQQRSRQKNQADNKEPLRACDSSAATSRADLTTATMTTSSCPSLTPTLQLHQQQPKSLDLLRSFTVTKQQQPLNEPLCAPDGQQIVITQPREQTQRAAQQVDSFQLVGACDASLVAVLDRCEPDSAQPAQAAKRKDSIQSQANDDDNFIDQILLSQERQEAVDSAGGAQVPEDDQEVDLVANLVGVSGGGAIGADQQLVVDVVVESSDIKVERQEMVVESV